MTAPLIAYSRVSTQKQGRSGLGLEGKRKAVQAFAQAEGFDIASEFTDIETGKGADALARRPQLKAALKAAKAAKCSFAVAALASISCVRLSAPRHRCQISTFIRRIGRLADRNLDAKRGSRFRCA